MELVRWNPARNLFCASDHMNRWLDDFFHTADPTCGKWGARRWSPSVDIFENDDTIIVKAEVPGMNKDDIEIDVKDRVLTLRGKRSSDEEVKEDDYYRRERTWGSFKRAFTLPENVDSEAIKADYKDGVLKIDIPKPEERKPRRITVH